MRLAVFLAALVAAGAGPSLAADRLFPVGQTPVDALLIPPLEVSLGDQLVLSGAVAGDSPATLVLRVDDGKSSSYATRVNEERTLPPGSFVWHFPLAGAKASGGRVIDPADIRRLMVFEPGAAGRIRIDRLAIEPASKLPDGAVGFSLGAPDAPVIAGLTRVAPGDPRITAGHPVAVRRPSPDPVLANGIVGLERLKLDWPPGRARVTLWLEDVGEWETLPHPLRRRVRVNGRDVVDLYTSPRQWIAERYLAGRNREEKPDDDAWTAYGRFRGGVVSEDVEVGDAGITIELAGDDAPSTFLSAVTIEPAGASKALDAVNAARRQWMTENFPVWTPQDASPSAIPSFTIGAPEPREPLKATVARGTGARLTFSVGGGRTSGAPVIAIEAPTLDDVRLDLGLYAAQRRLERIGADSNLLQRTANQLRGDPASLPILVDEPRRYVAWVNAAPDAPPGRYRGSVSFTLDQARVQVPLEIEVLPVDLPAATSSAGFYLDETPHLTWFDETKLDRGRQLSCDLATLKSFGVLGDAPGLTTPNAPDDIRTFVADSIRARDAGVAIPWLAYAPLKRMIATEGPSAAGRAILAADAALAAAGVPAPIWALFDEPGNLGGGGDGPSAVAAELRRAAPGVKLAGQLNHPDDRRYLDSIDVAIVNPGFGIDAGVIEMLKAQGQDVWIYNTGAPRFTAGLWLWRTHASRYLQWHARMPTADPFDPTDGREGDVQVFPPMAEVCALRQDIDASLIEMAEGIVDQRWLQWLASRPENAARALLARIIRETPPDWNSAVKGGAVRSAEIRRSVEDLARDLK